ncbi:MAG: YcgL domain-containing protein, partial [Chromatiaceae bacterium]
PPVFVMELALHPERRLAREDVAKVMTNLDTQGFHLQMPPQIRPDFLPSFHQSTLH